MNARAVAVAEDPFVRALVPCTAVRGARLDGGVVCHTGSVRKRNEDAWFADAEVGLFVVADGMGGHAAGDVASAMAVDVLAGLVEQEGAVPVTEAGAALRHAFSEASQRIFEAGGADVARRGMGTTLVALWVCGEVAVWAHVGDSRLYRLRDGAFTPLTLDHTPLGDMVRRGQIDRASAERHGPVRLLSRSVGTFPVVRTEVGEGEVRPGDRFLLCSDGLSDVVSRDTLARLLSDGPPSHAARALTMAALEGGGPDNITAMVVDFE